VKRFLLATTIVAAIAVGGFFAARPAYTIATPRPPADAVARLRRIVPPEAGEDPFATIPWETDLTAARAKAAAAGKPLLLWEMDGHPLACG